ncbi:uncharacterized protein METZ01_LOCUS108851 [marine metagenome]|uniref:Uncharacterized protein n=1 Tax=marine metagenome TaxID=408172 RepID=A0A381WVQ6_9ZZZZ
MAVNKLDISMMEDVGTSASQLLQRDGSGNLPAVNASQVTGLSEFTTTTSDPAIDTNPSGGVGSLWYNKTDGEMYVCTDATAGANVWTNVGAGSGDVAPWELGRTNYGWTAGHYSSGYYANINKYSFTSDGNATDAGDLSRTKVYVAAASSITHGYCAGGVHGSPQDEKSDMVEKFAFASDGNGIDTTQDLIEASNPTGCNSETYGYTMGGHTNASNNVDHVWKYAFDSTANATDVGNLTVGRYANSNSSSSSAAYGYMHGGSAEPSVMQHEVIDKFSFSSDGDAADVGDLTFVTSNPHGASSSTYGHCMGGYSPSAVTNVISRYSFASDGNAVDWGDLTVARHGSSSSSATTHGYCTGGVSTTDVIDKFPYASSSGSTDVGNLVTGGYAQAGHQS